MTRTSTDGSLSNSRGILSHRASAGREFGTPLSSQPLNPLTNIVTRPSVGLNLLPSTLPELIKHLSNKVDFSSADRSGARTSAGVSKIDTGCGQEPKSPAPDRPADRLVKTVSFGRGSASDTRFLSAGNSAGASHFHSVLTMLEKVPEVSIHSAAPPPAALGLARFYVPAPSHPTRRSGNGSGLILGTGSGMSAGVSVASPRPPARSSRMGPPPPARGAGGDAPRTPSRVLAHSAGASDDDDSEVLSGVPVPVPVLARPAPLAVTLPVPATAPPPGPAPLPLRAQSSAPEPAPMATWPSMHPRDSDSEADSPSGASLPLALHGSMGVGPSSASASLATDRKPRGRGLFKWLGRCFSLQTGRARANRVHVREVEAEAEPEAMGPVRSGPLPRPAVRDHLKHSASSCVA